MKADDRGHLPPQVRQRLEEMVRPLYAGLDGVQTFGRVDHLRRHLEEILPDGGVAGDHLELLVLLHGVVDRLGSLAAGGRLDLFLRGLGLAEDLVRRVRAGLGRLSAAPQGLEEELIHDALLLEAAGIVAAAERLMAAGKKRTPIGRAIAQLDPGPAAERYRTPRARELGRERRLAAADWVEALRREVQRATPTHDTRTTGAQHG